MAGVFCIDCARDARTVLAATAKTFGVAGAVGRYLPVYPLSAEEAAAIHAAGAAIIPIWNRDGYGAAIGSAIAGLGTIEGHTAAAAWQVLGLPAGCAIFYDIEAGWRPDAERMAEWIRAVHAGGYVPGFYLNPVAGTGHDRAYQAARAATTGLPCVHWTSQHELYAYQDVRIADFVVDATHAAAVPGYEPECVLWQYWENSLNGTIDLDCAKDLSLFWRVAPPKPAYPQPYHVVVPGSLKTRARGASTPAIDNQKPPQHVWLEVGAAVKVTGHAVRTDDDWYPVSLVHPESVVHGWFPVKSLAKD